MNDSKSNNLTEKWWQNEKIQENGLNNVRIILESDMHLGRFMQISLTQISSRTRQEITKSEAKSF